jgi:hypothetical protein
MTRTGSSTISINGPAELLAAVPHLLGFRPEESLVIIGLADRQLVVTARLDLADARDHGRCLGDTLAAIVRGGTMQVVGAVYTADTVGPDGRLPHSDVADRLVIEVDRAGAQLVDCLLVTGGRWWSYTCHNLECCPAEGRAMHDEPTLFQVEATYAGLTVAASRDAMAQRLTPLQDRHRLQGLINDAEDTAALALRRGRLAGHDTSVKRAIFAAARAAAQGDYPSDAQAARYGAALTRIAIRDAVWLAVDDGRLAVDDGRLTGGELWLDLARRLPTPYDAPALFLYAWQAWRAGNGALAGMAAERAIASSGDYSAADLLLAALARGINPQRIPKLRLPKDGDAPTTA